VHRCHYLLTALLCWGAAAAEIPSAQISNGLIQAKFYLPDAETGYYRGTRFEWSGVIESLRYAGHEYFGQWFEKYDPKIHDAIMGPVEEFRTEGGGLGYTEAKAGGTFIRIGVGAVRKPDEPAYRTFGTYDIVNPGKWNVRKGGDWIEFTHELKDDSGYAYVYRKTVRLVKGKPGMRIEHSLKNTGRRAIETLQYNHNFFTIDRQTTGPDITVKFPFDLSPKADFKGLAEVRGGELVYLRQLEKGQSVFSQFEGYGKTAKDYDVRIENRKTGAGVRIVGDQPLARVVFWSIHTTVCPEPYIAIQAEPGREFRWNIDYSFYVTQ
jgi:hypothetical protein